MHPSTFHKVTTYPTLKGHRDVLDGAVTFVNSQQTRQPTGAANKPTKMTLVRGIGVHGQIPQRHRKNVQMRLRQRHVKN